MKLPIYVIAFLAAFGWLEGASFAQSRCASGDTDCVLGIMRLESGKLESKIMKIMKEEIDKAVAEARKSSGDEKKGGKEFRLTKEQVKEIVGKVLVEMPAPTAGGTVVSENEIVKVAGPLIKQAVAEAIKNAVASEVTTQLAEQAPPELPEDKTPAPTKVTTPVSTPSSHATLGFDTQIVTKIGIFLIVQVGREGSCLRGICSVAGGAGWSPDKDFAISATASQLWGWQYVQFGLSATVAIDTGIHRGSPLGIFGVGPTVSWTPSEWLGFRASLLAGMSGRRDPATGRSDTDPRAIVPLSAFLRF